MIQLSGLNAKLVGSRRENEAKQWKTKGKLRRLGNPRTTGTQGGTKQKPKGHQEENKEKPIETRRKTKVMAFKEQMLQNMFCVCFKDIIMMHIIYVCWKTINYKILQNILYCICV